MPQHHFSLLDWLVVAIYLAVMFYIGHWAARRKTDARGYFLGGRQMPFVAVTLSVVATNLSVATFMGGPQESFDGDLTYLSVNIGYIIAAFIVATIFVPRLYQAGTVTIYGFLGQRFGKVAVIGASATFLLGRLLASGARLFIAAIPVCLLMYGSVEPSRSELITAICVIGALGVAYTVAGGIKAVIWTDTVQIIIVCGAALLSIALLLHEIPLSLGGIYQLLSTPHSGPNGSKLLALDPTLDMSRKYSIWAVLIGATFLGTASSGTDHDVAQRMLTTKSKSKASLSLIASQFVTAGVQAIFLAIGLLLFIFYKRPDIMGGRAPHDIVGSSMQVYPQFLLNHLPSGLRGLAMAGMFAAAQGSLDSAINAMASSAVADIYWPIQSARGKAIDTGQRSPRIAVACMGILLIAFAIASAIVYDPHGSRSLLDFALGVMAFAYTGLLGVFLTALLSRRGNSRSVVIALLAGALTTTLLQPNIFAAWTTRLAGHPLHLASFWWMPIGTAISFTICCAGRASTKLAKPLVETGSRR